MKKWIVRFVSMLVYNVIVLLLIGVVTPARVGWTALWAGIVMTVLVIWVKPLMTRWFRSMAKSAVHLTKAGQKLVEFILAFAIAFIVWTGTVLLSSVRVVGWWGWVLPPVLLLVGWAVYAALDDRIEAKTASLYDRAEEGIRGRRSSSEDTLPAGEPAPGTRDRYDGLTAEQRRMLDDLGKE